MALLKFLFTLFLVYYLIKFLFNLLVPSFLKNLTDKMNTSNNTNASSKNEGEISIKVTKKDKKIDKDIGEYTDFEEIND